MKTNSNNSELEKEKVLINRVNSSLFALSLTDEAVEICKKHGVDPNKYSYQEQGILGHKLANKTPIGAHIVGKGYYKIVGIKNNYPLPSGVFDEVLVTYYSKHFRTDFLEEEILINARPFYNNASIGPKSQLKVGMILHIKEDTTVVNKTYRIVWEIL